MAGKLGVTVWHKGCLLKHFCEEHFSRLYQPVCLTDEAANPSRDRKSKIWNFKYLQLYRVDH